MADEERTGTCPCCARRDPRRRLVCDVCRSKLRSWLREIPDLYGELGEQHDAPPVDRDLVLYPPGHKREGEWVTHLDELAVALPAGAVAGQALGGPVSGSTEPRLPIRVDPLDLAAPARNVHLLGEDQVGYESVASELDFWVRDWREARGGLERLPDPDVSTLASWLERRAEDACDAHPAVDEMFEAVARLRSALRRQVGQADVPDYKQGVPCRRCDAMALVRVNGSDWIECADCPELLSPEEYERWCGLLAEQAKSKRRERTTA